MTTTRRLVQLLSAMVFIVSANALALSLPKHTELSAHQIETMRAGAHWHKCDRSMYCGGCVDTTSCNDYTCWLSSGGVSIRSKGCKDVSGGMNGCADNLAGKKRCRLTCIWTDECNNDQTDCGQLRRTGCSSYVPTPATGMPHCPVIACYNVTGTNCANCTP